MAASIASTKCNRDHPNLAFLPAANMNMILGLYISGPASECCRAMRELQERYPHLFIRMEGLPGDYDGRLIAAYLRKPKDTAKTQDI